LLFRKIRKKNGLNDYLLELIEQILDIEKERFGRINELLPR